MCTALEHNQSPTYQHTHTHCAASKLNNNTHLHGCRQDFLQQGAQKSRCRVASGVTIGRARRAVQAGPALWGAQNLPDAVFLKFFWGRGGPFWAHCNLVTPLRVASAKGARRHRCREGRSLGTGYPTLRSSREFGGVSKATQRGLGQSPGHKRIFGIFQGQGPHLLERKMFTIKPKNMVH